MGLSRGERPSRCRPSRHSVLRLSSLRSLSKIVQFQTGSECVPETPSGTTLRGDIGVVPSSSCKCLKPPSCFPAVVQPLSSCCPVIVQLLSSRCPAVGTSIQN